MICSIHDACVSLFMITCLPYLSIWGSQHCIPDSHLSDDMGRLLESSPTITVMLSSGCAQRGSSEAEALKADQAAYREQVLANLQDDRRARQRTGSGSLESTPEGPDKVADPEAIASYRDRKHGQVYSNDDWKVNPNYVPVQFDGSLDGARKSYKEE